VRVIVANDADDAASVAADVLVRACSDAIDERGRAVVAVSGGTTPWAMLREFAASPLPWPAIHVAQVDERCVGEDDPRRNGARLEELLVRHGPLPAANLLLVPAGAASCESAAARYAATLQKHFGAPAVFDVVQLGLGADGHTASLVAGDPALAVADRDVAVTRPYHGTARVTLTYPALDRARQRLWLVTGSGKTRAVTELLDAQGSAPAMAVAREATTVVVDRAAAPGRG
jgi:6-phosphogluconolactonase